MERGPAVARRIGAALVVLLCCVMTACSQRLPEPLTPSVQETPSASPSASAQAAPINLSAGFSMARGSYTFEGSYYFTAGPFTSYVADSPPGQGTAVAPAEQSGWVKNTTEGRNVELELPLEVDTYLAYPVDSVACTIFAADALNDLETSNLRYCLKMVGQMWTLDNFTPGSQVDLGPGKTLDFTTIRFTHGPEGTIPSMIAAGDDPAAILITGREMSKSACQIPVVDFRSLGFGYAA